MEKLNFTKEQKQILDMQILYPQKGVCYIGGSLKEKLTSSPIIFMTAIKYALEDSLIFHIQITKDNTPYLAKTEIELSEWKNKEEPSEEQVQKWMGETRPFYNAPLYELHYWTDGEYIIFYLKTHHIILDGYSFTLILKKYKRYCRELISDKYPARQVDDSYISLMKKVDINNDKENGISEGLEEYIKSHSKSVDVDTSNQDAVNDAIFYRDVNYVIYIPKNFGEDILEGKSPRVEYKSSGDQYSSYSEMLVEKYIKLALIYKDYYKNDELISKINETINIDSQIELKTNLDTSKLSSATRYFNFLNYAFLAGCVYCISMILASLKERNVSKRTIISSYDLKKYNRVVLLALSVVIFAMWLLYMILSFIIFGDLMLTFNGVTFMINSFIYAICTLTIGFFIGNITQNKNAIGGIVNVVALGSSFLCGCFVPFEYMPDYVVKLAHIFPTYYFVSNNELIRNMEIFDFINVKQLGINIFIIIVYSLIFVVLTNFISKKKRVLL